jgi:Transcription initiation factor IIA, gamma subunit, helical domain
MIIMSYTGGAGKHNPFSLPHAMQTLQLCPSPILSIHKLVNTAPFPKHTLFEMKETEALSTLQARHVEHINSLYRASSIGLTLVDTLDDMVNEGRIEPQLAMKVVARFDRAIAEVLGERVRARLSFKVRVRSV